MNFDITDEQQMMRETFSRFLDENSSCARVRMALPSGFDPALWQGLAELGALAIRVPEERGGMGMGLFDALLLMEEAGRTLVSGPLAETMLAARLLGQLRSEAVAATIDTLLERVVSGGAIVTIALHDIATRPRQWVAGGLVVNAVIARCGDDVVLALVPEGMARYEENLASMPMAELDLASLERTVLASGADAVAVFAAAIEEWKLLTAAGINGLTREAIRLAAAYACERRQFGQFIGTFQAISHPLADLVTETEASRFLIWKAVRDLADGSDEAGSTISLALWWNSELGARAAMQTLHTFGGYGLSTEYDIHLYNLRAKAWPLILGDPERLLQEAGRRLYTQEAVSLPEPGLVPYDFDLGEEAQSVRAELEALFQQHVTDEMRAGFHYSMEGYVPAVHKMLASNKLLFPQLPGELTGRKIGHYARSAVSNTLEDLGYTTPIASVAGLVAMVVHMFGSDELKAEILPRILAGDALCSLGFSEPGSGSDVFAAQCKAVQEGNQWRIDGTKMFTSAADKADYALMLCRTNPDVAKHKGLTMFIVPLKDEGVTIQPVHTFQDERTNITFYDGVKIPDSWRLGEVDAGARTMSAALSLEHGADFSKQQLDLVEAARQLCEEQVCDDGERLIEHGFAQVRLARAKAHAWAARILAYRAQWANVEQRPSHAFGQMAKLYSSEMFQRDSRDLLDLTAPLSLSKRSGAAGFLNQCYRHAHGTTIYGGTSEVHRSMVAERFLGLPRTRA